MPLPLVSAKCAQPPLGSMHATKELKVTNRKPPYVSIEVCCTKHHHFRFHTSLFPINVGMVVLQHLWQTSPTSTCPSWLLLDMYVQMGVTWPLVVSKFHARDNFD